MTLRHALITLGLLTALGCGGPVRAALDGQLAGARVEGVVTVEPIEGAEQLVTVSVEALPAPAEVSPDLRTYVVWFIDASHSAQRAGELVYEVEYREGRLDAETALEGFRLKITGERNADATAPSEHVIVDQWVGES